MPIDQCQPNSLSYFRPQAQTKHAHSISIGKIKPVIKMLASEGVKLTDLLLDTGICLSDLTLYDAKIDYQQYFQLINNATRLAANSTFALQLGEQFYINHDGILACRVMSCQNAAEAMHLLADYQSLLTQLFQLNFTEQNNFGVFTAIPAFTSEICLPYFIEYTFSSIYALGKFCTGQANLLLEYEFSYNGAEKKSAYEAFFGPNVRFNCDENRVFIPKSILSMPFIFEDQTIAKRNDKICQDRIRLVHQQTSVIEQVRALFIKHKFRNVSLQAIAEELCLSPRTLRRHLRSENISYQSLLEDERKRVVRKALIRDVSIKTISEQLGYHDASSFSRAFKQWFGTSPNEYKENVHTFD